MGICHADIIEEGISAFNADLRFCHRKAKFDSSFYAVRPLRSTTAIEDWIMIRLVGEDIAPPTDVVFGAYVDFIN